MLTGLPPLVITPQQVEHVFDIFAAALEAAVRDAQVQSLIERVRPIAPVRLTRLAHFLTQKARRNYGFNSALPGASSVLISWPDQTAMR